MDKKIPDAQKTGEILSANQNSGIVLLFTVFMNDLSLQNLPYLPNPIHKIAYPKKSVSILTATVVFMYRKYNLSIRCSAFDLTAL